MTFEPCIVGIFIFGMLKNNRTFYIHTGREKCSYTLRSIYILSECLAEVVEVGLVMMGIIYCYVSLFYIVVILVGATLQ